jgi:hypothetical protein
MNQANVKSLFTKFFNKQLEDRKILVADLKAEGLSTIPAVKDALVWYAATLYGIKEKKGEGCKSGVPIMDTKNPKYKTAQRWANRKLHEIFEMPKAPKAPKPALRVEPTFAPSRAQKNAALALLGLCKGDAKAAAAILKAIAA